MYAAVMIDLKTNEILSRYDYIIPQELLGFLEVGMRVVVPFNTIKRAGIVVEIKKTSENANKTILFVLDQKPIITKPQFHLLEYLEKETFVSQSMAFKYIVPNALQLKYDKKIIVLDRSKLGDLNALLEKDVMPYDNTLSEYQYAIQKAYKQGYLDIVDDIKEKGKIKYTIFYTKRESAKGFTPKRDEIIRFIGIEKVSLEQLIEAGFKKDLIKQMVKDDVLKEHLVESFKQSKTLYDKKRQPIVLTDAQSDAINRINETSTYKRFLLHGVTASGKTEIFYEIIKALKDDVQVLIMVPEILMIYPIWQYLNQLLDSVYIYHSELSAQERYDTWRQIKNGHAKVIITTRSGVFLPFKSLSMIIMDEAHDKSFFEANRPRYHAVELSRVLAKYHDIPLIYSTSTPSIEMFDDALTGKITYLQMNEKIHATDQTVDIIDMKAALESGNLSMFSRPLEQALKHLKNGEQAMILLNRRGYAPFVMCRACGYVQKCPDCQMSMVYHKQKKALICHHCSYKMPEIKTCPTCKSSKVKPVGIGIEQLEEALIKLLPDKVIKRFDSDTISKKNIEQILADFMDKKIDILAGTQLLSKGLDFDIKLSSVLLADIGLNQNSYLATEQTYQLIKQMQGRGSRYRDGAFIVQTYMPNHFVFENLDAPYKQFYQIEIENRRMLNQPPFSKMIKITLSHTNETELLKTMKMIKNELIRYHSQYTVLGPNEASIPYFKKQFHYEILIKTPKRIDLSYIMKKILYKYGNQFEIDINPYSEFM